MAQAWLVIKVCACMGHRGDVTICYSSCHGDAGVEERGSPSLSCIIKSPAGWLVMFAHPCVCVCVCVCGSDLIGDS